MILIYAMFNSNISEKDFKHVQLLIAHFAQEYFCTALPGLEAFEADLNKSQCSPVFIVEKYGIPRVVAFACFYAGYGAFETVIV